MNTEIAYIGKDNKIDIQLLEDGIAVDLSTVTRMTLQLGTTILDSAVHSGVFDWSAGNGVLKLSLGGQTITVGFYYARLVIYSPSYLNGIVWGEIPIMILA